MSKYDIQRPPIEGLQVITPEVEGCSREHLFDLTMQDEYKAMELDAEFTQHTLTRYNRGVIQGLHFQRSNSAGVFIAVKSGGVLAVGVDLRPECKTFGAAHAVELTADNERMFYIPPYFAHGFMTLEHNTEVVCNYTESYDASAQSAIIWDDEILAINWQFERFDIDEKRLNISQKDRKAPCFRSYHQNTLWINRPKKSKYAMSY